MLRSRLSNKAKVVDKGEFLSSIRNDLCYICFEDRTQFISTCCGSSIHYDCLQQWFIRNADKCCPVCKIRIVTSHYTPPTSSPINRVVPILTSPPLQNVRNETHVQGNQYQIYQLDHHHHNNNIFRIYNRVLSTYKMALTLFGIATVFLVILFIIYMREKAKLSTISTTTTTSDNDVVLFLKTSNFIEAILYSISSFFICSIIFNVVN